LDFPFLLARGISQLLHVGDIMHQVYAHPLGLLLKPNPNRASVETTPHTLLNSDDGRKSFPIKHGPTSEETFVKDAAKVCKEFMSRDPDEVRFTVLALTAAQD